MATETIIVTPIEIVKRTPLNGNVDVDKFAFLIPDQQRFILEESLGTALFNKILDDIETLGIDNLLEPYKLIVFSYCKPILINSVFAEFINFADVTIDNNGVFNVLPADSQVVDNEKVLRMVKTYREKAQVYLSRMERYLSDKGYLIPEYQDAQPENYDIDPVRNSNIVGGLYLKSNNKLPWYLDESDI